MVISSGIFYILFFLITLALSIVVGVLAKKSGRKLVPWMLSAFVLSFLLSLVLILFAPFVVFVGAVVVLLIMGKTDEQKEIDRQRLEARAMVEEQAASKPEKTK